MSSSGWDPSDHEVDRSVTPANLDKHVPKKLVEYLHSLALLDGKKHKIVYRHEGEEEEFDVTLEYRTYQTSEEHPFRALPPAVVELKMMNDEGGLAYVFVEGFVYTSVMFQPEPAGDFIPFENHNRKELKDSTPTITNSLIRYLQYAELMPPDEIETELDNDTDDDDTQEIPQEMQAIAGQVNARLDALQKKIAHLVEEDIGMTREENNDVEKGLNKIASRDFATELDLSSTLKWLLSQELPQSMRQQAMYKMLSHYMMLASLYDCVQPNKEFGSKTPPDLLEKIDKTHWEEIKSKWFAHLHEFLIALITDKKIHYGSLKRDMDDLLMYTITLYRIADKKDVATQLNVLLNHPAYIGIPDFFGFSRKIPEMEEDSRAALIAALLRKDSKLIHEAIFNSATLKKEYLPQELDFLAQYLSKNLKHSGWKRNPYLKALIHGLFHSDISREASVQILQSAFQKIPDREISVTRKRKIAIGLSRGVGERIHDFTYVEIPQALKPEPQEKSKKYDTESRYFSAIATARLDLSEFILLTAKYFARRFPDDANIKADLNAIRQSYWKLDYETAIEKLKRVCENQKAVLGESLDQKILDKIPYLNPVEAIENHSRRFYENRIIQHYCADQIDYASISKITQFFMKKDVSSVKDVETAIVAISEMMDESCFEVDNNFRKYSRAPSSRVSKAGFVHKNDEAEGAASDAVFSRNMGVMTSLSPNYYDEISENDIRNRVVDKSRPNFASRHLRYAYAAGAAGHAFCISSVLRKYIEKHENDPDLQNEINAFLKAFRAIYSSRGYHSLKEMELPFLKENNILFEESGKTDSLYELYSKHHIELDFDFSEDILQEAFAEAGDYAETLCLKKSMQQMFFSHPAVSDKVSKQQQEFETLAVTLQARVSDLMQKIQECKSEHPELHGNRLRASFLDLISRYNELIDSYESQVKQNAFHPTLCNEIKKCKETFDEMVASSYEDLAVPSIFATILPQSPFISVLKAALPDSKEVAELKLRVEAEAKTEKSSLPKISVDPELVEQAKAAREARHKK